MYMNFNCVITDPYESEYVHAAVDHVHAQEDQLGHRQTGTAAHP